MFSVAGLSRSARVTAGSALSDKCLTVVTVAKIRTTQNAPAIAENIKRGSIARSNQLTESPITVTPFPKVNPFPPAIKQSPLLSKIDEASNYVRSVGRPVSVIVHDNRAHPLTIEALATVTRPRFSEFAWCFLRGAEIPVLWRKRHWGPKVTPGPADSRHSESATPRVRCLGRGDLCLQGTIYPHSIAGTAIAVLGIGVTQAGWTHRWFVRAMFALGFAASQESLNLAGILNEVPTGQRNDPS